MRKEKLDELRKYIEELKTIRKSLVPSEYIYDENNRPIKRNGFLDIERYEIELANGKVVLREKILKGGKDPSAAIVMPLTVDDNTVLVVQSRSSTEESVCVEFPAGYIEDGEAPEIGGAREVAEETGYIPEKMILLDKFYQDQSCGVGAYNYSYLALGCSKARQQKLDDNEAIRYFECSIDEAIELMEQGYMTDIQSKYTLSLAKTYLKEKKNYKNN